MGHRREFIGLSSDDTAILTRLIPLAESRAPLLSKRFYDHQFSFEPTHKFFKNHAADSNQSLATLRSFSNPLRRPFWSRSSPQPMRQECSETRNPFAKHNSVSRVMATLEKVFNYDLQAIGDAFVVSALEGLGVSISNIEPAPGNDRLDHLGEVKELANQTAAATSEIEDKIKRIRTEIPAAVTLIPSIVHQARTVDTAQSRYRHLWHIKRLPSTNSLAT
ncbi:MAG: hypothetical protein GY708_02090 [Actinomycetia bacterium]|nr:hypothetical protein [Actinomycetes bacterium]